MTRQDAHKPPQDIPPHDYAVIRSAGSIRKWQGAYWTWHGGDWVYRGEVSDRTPDAVTRQDVIDQIATILHRYDHPAYDTVAYCTFCHAAAVQALEMFEGSES